MNKEEQDKFVEDLLSWLSENKNRHRIDFVREGDSIMWGAQDVIDGLELLVKGIDEYRVGQARLLRGEFRYLTPEQIKLFEEFRDNFVACAESVKDTVNILGEILDICHGS